MFIINLFYLIINIFFDFFNRFFVCHFNFWSIEGHFSLVVTSSNNRDIFTALELIKWATTDYFIVFGTYLGIYIEIFFIVSILLLIIFFVIFDNLFEYKFILSPNISYIFILIFLLMSLLLNNIRGDLIIFDSMLIEDNLGIFVQNILIINFILYIIISLNYIFCEKIVNYEYFLLLGLAFLGMITMVKCNDLISLYFAIELQSLVFYIIASFKIYTNFSTEAGLKYFILGSFSSGILLFGCSLIYGFVGTTNFDYLHILFIDKIQNNIFIGFLLGIVFVIIGILFKVGAAPFHMWLPDVYEGVPTIVTAFFAIIPKIALFTLLYRLGVSFCASNFFFWNQLFIYVALLSIVIGTLGGLYQIKIKRLIAYSAISHTGFILIGYSSFTDFSIFATYVYILVYIVISFNIFALLLSLRKRDNFLKLKKLNEFVVLFKSNSLLAINFCIILFSIAGIPPLLGFYSKFYIFFSAIKSNLYFVVFISAILSVIASMYYIRLIKLMFFKKFKYWSFFFEITKCNSIIISLTLFFNILFIFYSQTILIFIYNKIIFIAEIIEKAPVCHTCVIFVPHVTDITIKNLW